MRAVLGFLMVISLSACGSEPDNSGFIDPEDFEQGEAHDHDHDGDGVPDHDHDDHDHG